MCHELHLLLLSVVPHKMSAGATGLSQKRGWNAVLTTTGNSPAFCNGQTALSHFILLLLHKTSVKVL